MDKSFPKNEQVLTGLICPNTLKQAIRQAQSADLQAREGIKELLSSPHGAAPRLESTKSNEQKPQLDLWQHCFSILVEDFFGRKADLLRLNKARKNQIEDFLRTKVSNQRVTLEDAVTDRPGTEAHEALLLFAHQMSAFHFLQLLLVKKWVDLQLIPEGALAPSQHALNWNITGFLKKNSPKGMMGRHEWSFLKQNLFSWHNPSNEALQRLQLLLKPVDLSTKDETFPLQILADLGAKNRLSLLGFQPELIHPKALWRLLFEQKAQDLQMTSAHELIASPERIGNLLVSGLKNGESLCSLRTLMGQGEMQGIWAFTKSDFEKYLSEILILWTCANDIPQITIHERALLQEQNVSNTTKGASLFSEKLKLPCLAQFAACLPDDDSRELEDASSFLDQLKETGLLILASNQFWPTENSMQAQKMREAVVRSGCIRLIIDLRQLSGSEREVVPKGIFIIEKCSSKEIRDANRPQVLRLRGQLSAGQGDALIHVLCEQLKSLPNPGDVAIRNIGAFGENFRLESMSAAASQLQLGAAPWVTLSDPAFYEISAKLKRNPSRAFTLGTILKWRNDPESQTGKQFFSQRGIELQESSRGLWAARADDASASPTVDHHGFYFLQENNLPEDPSYFVSQILSAPVQFWHRLEVEHSANLKSPKANDRQSEQRLKLMPLVRLFAPGTLLPVQRSAPGFTSLEQVRSELIKIFRSPLQGMAERLRLHEIILSLEKSIQQNLELCSDFARHLFPDLEINRLYLPGSLPTIEPHLVLDIFRHLDRSSLLRHPSLHITKMKPSHDFKITNISYRELSSGALGELLVYQSVDAVLKIAGPSLLVRFAATELQKRIGRPWIESADKIFFPTDFQLLQTQVQEIQKSIAKQLQATKDCVNMMDQVFTCLFGLSSSFEDESTRSMMKHHLCPEDGKIVVQFQKDADQRKFIPRGLESPKGILQ